MGRVLASSKAAIDLASVMVGILIVGIVSGIIAATVFFVVPWTQDNAAKQQLNSINIAQSSYVGKTSGTTPSLALTQSTQSEVKASNLANFGSLKDLKDKGLWSGTLADGSNTTSSDQTLCVVGNGANFRAEIKSSSGNYYYSTDKIQPTAISSQNVTCLPKPAGPPISYDGGNVWTEGATINGVNQPVLFIDGYKVKTTSTQLVDWSIVLDRTQIPYSSLTDGNVQAITGLPGWASIKSDAQTITIYNNTPTARINKSTPATIGQLRFNYTIPTYTTAQTTVSAPYGIITVGTNKVQANLDVSLINAEEGRFGYWAADVDATVMRTAVGQDGTLTVSPTAATDGFSVTKKTGNIYTLTYSPTNAQAFMLKGKNAGHQSFYTNGVVTLNGSLIYTGSGAGAGATYTSTDGKTQVVVSGITSNNPPTVSTTYTTTTVGKWSVEINLKELRDLNRAKTPKFNNTNFTLTAKTGDTTGDIWVLTFNQTWNSATGQTTNTINLQ